MNLDKVDYDQEYKNSNIKYNMSKAAVIKEFMNFDKAFLEAGFNMMSSNYSKYKRGWMLKAESESVYQLTSIGNDGEYNRPKDWE